MSRSNIGIMQCGWLIEVLVQVYIVPVYVYTILTPEENSRFAFYPSMISDSLSLTHSSQLSTYCNGMHNQKQRASKKQLEVYVNKGERWPVTPSLTFFHQTYTQIPFSLKSDCTTSKSAQCICASKTNKIGQTKRLLNVSQMFPKTCVFTYLYRKAQVHSCQTAIQNRLFCHILDACTGF